MATYLVNYLVPAAVIDDWKRTDPATRGPAEQKMQSAWQAWMQAHAGVVTDTRAVGKTIKASAGGLAAARNDITLTCFVEAESHEAAAKLFAEHPHLQIPQSSIEIMEVRPMGAG